MQKILTLCILISISVLSINADDDEFCFTKSTTFYELFGGWTSYDAIKGATVLEKDCKPIFVWGLIKHGVKSVTDKQIERSKKLVQVKKDIEQNNKERRSALCAEDYQNIISWDNVLSDKQNEALAKKAYSNHEIFVEYLNNYIDSTQKPTKDNFEFLTSKVKGAAESAVTFAKKLFGSTSDKKEDYSITENEALLRSKDNCAKWTPSYKEADDFESSPIMKAICYRISNRLGYNSLLPFENILAMYESCAIEKSQSATNKPPFCAAFLPEDLKVLEYGYDLKHYYGSGYGNPLSDKMGCPLVKDMVDKLSKVSAGTIGDKKGAIYFGDDENLMGMATKLGLYRDQEALKHDNYQYQKLNRQWRSSTLSPYTATIHAVVFNCANNEKKVEFYHNQNIVKLEGCKSTTSTSNKCSLDTFLTEVKKSVTEDKCDDGFCGSSLTPSGANTIGFSFIVMIVCFFFNRL